MVRRYDAFLIRHWALDGDRGDRVEITHVQTGQHSCVTSLSQALLWIQERVAPGIAVERPPPDTSAPPDVAR